MLRTVAATALAAVVAVAGCGDDGADDAGDALARRLVAALEADGDAVDGAVDDADVSCPDVDDPAVGDQATCLLRFPDGRAVQVDLEFDDDGAFAVVAVVAP